MRENEIATEIPSTSVDVPAARFIGDRMYKVSIQQLDYGYFVEVGCNRFVVETSDKLIELLSNYIRNPKEANEDWQQNKTLPFNK